MTSNTYSYILADELSEWLLDKSEDKRTYEEFVRGLKHLALKLLYDCIYAVEESDLGYTSRNGRSYSELSIGELEKITHEICDKY